MFLVLQRGRVKILGDNMHVKLSAVGQLDG
jgi:hypothetical protein